MYQPKRILTLLSLLVALNSTPVRAYNASAMNGAVVLSAVTALLLTTATLCDVGYIVNNLSRLDLIKSATSTNLEGTLAIQNGEKIIEDSLPFGHAGISVSAAGALTSIASTWYFGHAIFRDRQAGGNAQAKLAQRYFIIGQAASNLMTFGSFALNGMHMATMDDDAMYTSMQLSSNDQGYLDQSQRRAEGSEAGWAITTTLAAAAQVGLNFCIAGSVLGW